MQDLLQKMGRGATEADVHRVVDTDEKGRFQVRTIPCYLAFIAVRTQLDSSQCIPCGAHCTASAALPWLRVAGRAGVTF